MLTFEKFKKIMTLLVNTKTEQEEYLNTVPSDLAEIVYDNKYVNLEAILNDRLVDYLFGEQSQDVIWFLYEKSVSNTSIVTNDKIFVINTLDDFFQYIQEVWYA